MSDGVTPGGNPVCIQCGRWNCVCDRTIHHSPNMTDEDARLFAEYVDWLAAKRQVDAADAVPQEDT